MLSSGALFELADRCAELRRQVLSADVLSIAKPATLSQAAMMRAGSYIWLAAGLERFVREELKLLLHDITAASVKTSDIRLSLLALLLRQDFDRVASSGSLKVWAARTALLEKAMDAKAAVFDSNTHPLDR